MIRRTSLHPIFLRRDNNLMIGNRAVGPTAWMLRMSGSEHKLASREHARIDVGLTHCSSALYRVHFLAPANYTASREGESWGLRCTNIGYICLAETTRLSGPAGLWPSTWKLQLLLCAKNSMASVRFGMALGAWQLCGRRRSEAARLLLRTTNTRCLPRLCSSAAVLRPVSFAKPRTTCGRQHPLGADRRRL